MNDRNTSQREGNHRTDGPVKPALPSLWSRIEEQIWAVPDETAKGVKLFAQRWLQILDRSVQGWIANRGYTSASALTYITLLSILPLMAILVTVLKGFGMHEIARDALLRMIASLAQTTAEPSPLQQVLSDNIDKVFQFVEKTPLKGLGVMAVLGLLWAVGSLLSKIEDAMNDAWAVHRSRGLGRKISDYFNFLVVLLLLLAAMSTVVTRGIIQFSGLWDRLGFNAAQAFLIKVLPYVMFILALIFLYGFMPNARVRWRSAVGGGLLAGVILEVSLLAFSRLSGRMLERYNKIYGTFGTILVLLAGVYVSWCIILWGVEACSAHQNLRDWRRRRREWRGTPLERETLAMRLGALLAAPLLDEAQSHRMDPGDLADALTLPPGPVGEMLDLFQANGLVVQTAEDGTYLLCKSPEKVSVLDILRLVRQGTLEPPKESNGLLSEHTTRLRAPLSQMTLKDLASVPLDKIGTLAL